MGKATHKKEVTKATEQSPQIAWKNKIFWADTVRNSERI